jgi:hypothetical protein
LGLTLCYEAEDSQGRTEIFIDDIHQGGLAERDGRLRLGDQIVQVKRGKIVFLSQPARIIITCLVILIHSIVMLITTLLSLSLLFYLIPTVL